MRWKHINFRAADIWDMPQDEITNKYPFVKILQSKLQEKMDPIINCNCNRKAYNSLVSKWFGKQKKS